MILIVVPKDEGYDYQYHIRDHLGNVRVTFSTTPENYTMLEDFEDTQSSFTDLHTHTDLNANTTAGGDKVALLQSGQTGAMTFLCLNKGDTIHLSVKANYESAPTGNTFLATAYDVLFGQFNTTYGGAIEGGVTATATEFDEALFGLDAAGKGSTSTAPRAYLNYLIFDSEMAYVSGGFTQISTAALRTAPGTYEEIGLQDIIADREGYILAYLSNENQEDATVFFDDFTVYHGKTNVVSSSDFYPFGLAFGEYQRTASTKQNFKYAGNEQLEGTGWLDFNARMYQPDLGRFISVDPLASYKPDWTPFRYAFNNPIRFIDPDGLMEIDDVMSLFNSAPDGISSYDGDGNCTCGCEGKPPCKDENNASVGLAINLALQQTVKQGTKTGLSLAGSAALFAIAMILPSNMEAGDNGSSLWGVEQAGEMRELEDGESLGTLTKEQEQRLAILRDRFNKFSNGNSSFPDLVGFRRDHILNRHRFGVGKPGKTEFPSGWTDNDIINSVNWIANDPNATKGVGKWNSPYKIGVVDGVKIRVDFYPSDHPHHSGKVSTAYPINVEPNK